MSLSSTKSFDPSELEIPAPQLLTYYILTALISGPFIIFALPAIWFRYKTLKYRFEETGMRMQVGLFFRHESVTAYRRIQDIHVSSGLVQRWLGISSISIQTASGSAMPEIVIEGVTEPDRLRDWLYERMRGAKGLQPAGLETVESNGMISNAARPDEATEILREIRDNLAQLVQRSESKNDA